MKFSYYMPTKICFGCGEFASVPAKIAALGKKKALILTGRTAMLSEGYTEQLVEGLHAVGLETVVFDNISPEPKTSEVNACVNEYGPWLPDVLVALGGGSAIDAAKGVVLGLATGEHVEAYLAGDKPVKPAILPIVAIPTTAGTGSETNRAAILTDEAAGLKASFRHDSYFPCLAVIDPLLTVSLPPAVTRETGFDVVAHAMETYLSQGGSESPLLEMHSMASIKLVAKWLPKALGDGSNINARSGMAYAATLMGFNLANSTTCLPHRLQYPLGVATGTSHGRGLMALTRSWLENTYEFSTSKFRKIGGALTGTIPEDREDFFAAYDSFARENGVVIRLRDLGLTEAQTLALAEKVQGNLSNDPAGAEPDIVRKIYQHAY